MSKLCIAVLLLVVQICTTYGDPEKTSLVFVIDDTASMYDEISRVKEETNGIFDAAYAANASVIENVVLVTFNDPEEDVKLRIVTKDRDEFRKAISDIDVHGGDDCPEYSLTGIELALNNSLPGSQFYVFTDASAKDYQDLEKVKKLALEKRSRLLFFLTDNCSGEEAEDFQVYYKLAEATGGQILHIKKEDKRINHVLLDSVHESIALAAAAAPGKFAVIRYDTEESEKKEDELKTEEETEVIKVEEDKKDEEKKEDEKKKE